MFLLIIYFGLFFADKYKGNNHSYVSQQDKINY